MLAGPHRRTAMRHEHLGPVTESEISDRVSLGSTCANNEQTPRTCRRHRQCHTLNLGGGDNIGARGHVRARAYKLECTPKTSWRTCATTVTQRACAHTHTRWAPCASPLALALATSVSKPAGGARPRRAPTMSGSASSCSRNVQCCTSYCIGICPYCSRSVLSVVVVGIVAKGIWRQKKKREKKLMGGKLRQSIPHRREHQPLSGTPCFVRDTTGADPMAAATGS